MRVVVCSILTDGVPYDRCTIYYDTAVSTVYFKRSKQAPDATLYMLLNISSSTGYNGVVSYCATPADVTPKWTAIRVG